MGMGQPWFFSIAIRPGPFRPFKPAAIVALAGLFVLVAGLFHTVGAPERPFAPPLAGRRIAVDPGHGGIDPGCHRGDLLEKELTLLVALALAERLEEQGASVLLTRTEDVELSHLTDQERTRHRRDLRARTLLAERHGAELLVSLHVNSAASERLGGAMLFHHPSSPGGRRLAEAILASLREVVPGNQNGVLPANFFLLRHSPATAILVEMGFISHPADRAVLTSEEGRQRIAAAIAAGIVNYLNEPGGAGGAPAPGAPVPERAAALSPVSPPIQDGHSCLQ